MTATTLRTAWLNDAATPSSWISLPYLTSLSVTPSAAGEVRRYAGGRLRAVTRVGTSRAASLASKAVTRAQVAWLEAHVGKTVCLRDDRGRRFFGVFWDVGITEHPYDTEADVSLDLSEITYSDAV